MTPVLPLREAAAALRTSESNLRRWIACGAPVARRGRRGRGCATLVDIAAVQAWRARDAGLDAGGDALRELAARLPELVAGALDEAVRLVPCKRDSASLAWLAAAGWVLATSAVLDAIRDRGIDVPQPAVPHAIERLRKIAAR